MLGSRIRWSVISGSGRDVTRHVATAMREGHARVVTCVDARQRACAAPLLRPPETRDVQTHALQLVRVIATRHEQLIEGTRQLLTSLTHAPEVSGHDPMACSAFFATVLRGQPLYTNLGVLGPDGTTFCRALPGTT